MSEDGIIIGAIVRKKGGATFPTFRSLPDGPSTGRVSGLSSTGVWLDDAKGLPTCTRTQVEVDPSPDGLPYGLRWELAPTWAQHLYVGEAYYVWVGSVPPKDHRGHRVAQATEAAR